MFRIDDEEVERYEVLSSVVAQNPNWLAERGS